MNNLIFSYSRADALRDGVLVDVSDLAAEAGFRFPVAVTQAVWEGWIRPPESARGQDVNGRLWDVLSVLRWTIREQAGNCDLIEFQVLLVVAGGRTTAIDFKAVCGPGDTLDPVITIMRPDED